jgi:hypothetical protein
MPAGVSAYTALANVTLGSTAATVTFSSISSSFRDLVLIVNGTINTASSGITFRLNGDTSSSYSVVDMYGDGSTTGSGSGTGTRGYLNYFNFTNSQSVWVANFMDYSATDKHTTVLSRANNSSSGTEALACRWANTSAVTSIEVTAFVGGSYVFNAGSTFALYGVSA